ncbi:protein FAM32A [Tribolium castaneum]|uniref:Protein FAM32A-like Protein n=1 Tax=Tribolium castaneum TaxID=7070 RepID=D6WJ24_TRICA|nr:PREDICTED: protein FAM32A [Tribolium castaneum]EFA03702.1 Protein FAM32A-like Protein [Tribolium castaneum]|eukprot:XP_008193013.1 PREDICTED: protein FAM32A [Tribolium castaneum]
MGQSDDPYAQVCKGKLQLKGDNSIKKKKKKKDKKLLEQVSKIVESETPESKPARQKTKAELAFLKQQEKMQTQRILEKASMTHKERVEKFNQHLDGLTEHFDIPKVSWTK